MVSLGWGFGNGLRAEIEGNYRNNHFNRLRRLHHRRSPRTAAATEQKFGAMVNVLYDFNGLTPWVVPYVGVGVGYQWAESTQNACAI